LLLVLVAAAVAEPLALPGATAGRWRADQAQPHGTWRRRAGCRWRRHLQPSGSARPAGFRIRTAEPVTLQVRPEWWRTGEQKPARRFPYPLVRQFGPTTLAAVGTEVFALAPAAGRVVVIDGASEKPVAAIEVGGYLTDMVADSDKGRVYLADAQGSRLVAIECASRQVLGALPVSGRPWALALLDGRMWRAAGRVVAFDTSSETRSGGVRPRPGEPGVTGCRRAPSCGSRTKSTISCGLPHSRRPGAVPAARASRQGAATSGAGL
jgi:hypothetical protein